MKLKRKNAATAKNFDFPFSFLYMAPKLHNIPITNAPNPEIISCSEDFGKAREQQNDSVPITANTIDQLLKRFIVTPFLLIIPIMCLQ
jgi:hypothetical protein